MVPLFSVYSQNSLGIGDFNDLKLLIDWACQTGNSIIQLLPMNEVGSLFCPYDSVSSFALEPAYLSLKDIPCANKKNLQDRISKMKEGFGSPGEFVNYSIKEIKLRLLREIFTQEFFVSRDFEKFLKLNSYWLEDFSLFKVLKRYFSGRAWYEWDAPFKNRSKEALADFIKKHNKEFIFESWVQWIIFNQFKSAKKYAKERGVFLKGDLPVLVSRDSADVWAHPEFFKLDFAAGAPPDMYCAKGQRWGMPTYNWQNIAEDNYSYLKAKLEYAQNFYDILRVDHVVGLFRIWSIPYNDPEVNQGLNGIFDPKDKHLWEEHGRSILTVMVKSTKMWLCAEDLGVVPVATPKILKELNVPGNDVQRWVKDWNVRHNFLNPEEYRELSVAVLSTHDTTNWPAWWENEAGTVDAELFNRKCNERGIDYNLVKGRLFNAEFSRHGRLRWKKEISSADILISILDKRKEEVGDLVEMHENTYGEKEKLWEILQLPGAMREKADKIILKAALKFVLGSRAVFSIQSIFDWFFLTDIFQGDPYQYRINTPGRVSPANWSRVLPISLDGLLKHEVSAEIKKMVCNAGRY